MISECSLIGYLNLTYKGDRRVRQPIRSSFSDLDSEAIKLHWLLSDYSLPPSSTLDCNNVLYEYHCTPYIESWAVLQLLQLLCSRSLCSYFRAKVLRLGKNPNPHQRVAHHGVLNRRPYTDYGWDGIIVPFYTLLFIIKNTYVRLTTHTYSRNQKLSFDHNFYFSVLIERMFNKMGVIFITEENNFFALIQSSENSANKKLGKF